MAHKVPAFGAIGASAKEVLSGGIEGRYQYNRTVTVVSKADAGLTLTSTVAQSDSNTTDSTVKAAYKSGTTSFAGTVTNNGKVSLNGGLSDLTPGLLLSLTGTYPELSTSSKVNVDYTLPHFTLKSSASLTQSPVAEVAVTFGENNAFAGADVTFDSSTNTATKYTLGGGYTGKDFQVGLHLLDKGQTVKAVYAHAVDSATTVAVEATHPVNKGGSIALVLGAQKRLDNGLLAKVKIDDKSVVSAHFEGYIHPKVIGGLSIQFNAKDSNQAPKWGFAASTVL